jgi:hypothetical protein
MMDDLIAFDVDERSRYGGMETSNGDVEVRTSENRARSTTSTAVRTPVNLRFRRFSATIASEADLSDPMRPWSAGVACSIFTDKAKSSRAKSAAPRRRMRKQRVWKLTARDHEVDYGMCARDIPYASDVQQHDY